MNTKAATGNDTFATKYKSLLAVQQLTT